MTLQETLIRFIIQCEYKHQFWMVIRDTFLQSYIYCPCIRRYIAPIPKLSIVILNNDLFLGLLAHSSEFLTVSSDRKKDKTNLFDPLFTRTNLSCSRRVLFLIGMCSTVTLAGGAWRCINFMSKPFSISW